MFERFDEGARRTITLAQERAHGRGDERCGTEHLLLGLSDGEDTVACRVLGVMGSAPERVRECVEQQVGPGASPSHGHTPFTPHAKKALELSLREALNLDHNHIGTEHLLLGLLHEGTGIGAKVLTQLGVDLHAARLQVAELMGTHAVPLDGDNTAPGAPGARGT